jgi:protein involved in polysaccharide export with SLBB domain
VSVLGEVLRPGAVAYFPIRTIVDAIASAGGFTGVAAKNSVNLRREVTGKVETRTFPVADISEGRSPNVVIQPGDVLVVEERLF